MKIDVEALDDRKKRFMACMPHASAAKRLGRAEAFRDIERRGFAYAYQCAEQIMGARDFVDLLTNQTWAFQAAYKEAVLGYWMSGSLEG